MSDTRIPSDDAHLVRTLRWHADYEEARIQRWRDKHPTGSFSHDGIMMVERIGDLRRAADRIAALSSGSVSDATESR